MLSERMVRVLIGAKEPSRVPTNDKLPPQSPYYNKPVQLQDLEHSRRAAAQELESGR
jgi:hypothetical protein